MDGHCKRHNFSLLLCSIVKHVLESRVVYIWLSSSSQSHVIWRHAWNGSIVQGNVKTMNSRPQRPRSFWSAPRIATSGLVQGHSGFEWLCKHNRFRPEPIRFVRLDSEHVQSDGKSVNRGLPVLDPARGRDSWCWPKGARFLGTRMSGLIFYIKIPTTIAFCPECWLMTL